MFCAVVFPNRAISAFQVILGLRGANKQLEDLCDGLLERNGVERPAEISLAENETRE